MVVGAVIVAAGSGRRFGEGPKKQFRELRGRPILAWAVSAITGHPRVARTVVVLPADDVDPPPSWLERFPISVVAGGATRGESVRAGLEALSGVQRVLVHDGARPLIATAVVDRVLDADPASGVVPGLPLTDTVKEVEGGRVVGTPPRDRLWRVQTPQCFPYPLLLEVYRRAAEEGFEATDDAGLLERYGHTVRVVEGDPMNVKVTTAFDLTVVEALAASFPLPTPP